MESENKDELAAETADIRDILIRRYDEIVSGKVQPVDGEEVFVYLRQRIESRRTGV